jgi:hypothetical protein
MPVPIREQVLAAFFTALQQIVGVTVERNRNREVTPEMMPALVMLDGGQRRQDESGLARYVAEADVEGYVLASSDAGLGPALNDLYARTVVAALADHTLGGVAIDVREGALDVMIVREAGKPAAGVSLTFEIEFFAAPADPFVPAP